ncbi:MAG: hypothetical protein WD535_04260 [Thermaerobacterales bacterium]
MKQAIEEIPDRMAAGAGKDWGSGSADALLQEWLDADRPDKVIGALDRALEDGARLVPLADVLARAGIYRVAHYPAANEEDWDSVLHVMSYNNALAGLARRIAGLGPAAEQELMRGVFHGAHFVHLNYFLNIPRARLPRERNPDGVPAADAEALCERWSKPLSVVKMPSFTLIRCWKRASNNFVPWAEIIRTAGSPCPRRHVISAPREPAALFNRMPSTP